MLKSSKALAAEEGGNDAAPKSYDVVVVGSGGAGLAAAIQAHDEGASVLIVEKNANHRREHHQGFRRDERRGNPLPARERYRRQ